MTTPKSKTSVNLEFYAVKLPPVRDILVVTKKYPQGRVGVMESFRFIAPDEFEMIDIDDPGVVAEAVLVNRRILQRIDASQVLALLEEHVFPFISPGEAITVDVDVHVRATNVELPDRG